MKQHLITADFCNKHDLSNEEIAQILINSFSNGEARDEKETFIRNQFLACLTTSRSSNWPSADKPFTTHTIHIDKSKGKEVYQKCQKALEEAGFTTIISAEKGIMEVKWNEPKTMQDGNSEFKDYYTFYSGEDQEPVKQGSDRERITAFLAKWEEKLEGMEEGETIEINAQEDFPENLYKSVETLMAKLLSKGYKAKIDYFSYPPKVSVEVLSKEENEKSAEGVAIGEG
ncbi:MAG: hypothetical protein IJB90_04630 [Clostridia bacterium]|nr:hypothetical protein [Clostridia bacterium]